MKTILKLFEDNDKISELLRDKNLQTINLMTVNGESIGGNKRKVFFDKVNSLIEFSNQEKGTLLVRGENRKNLMKKLNSNDPEFELLFLIGDKAKNYIREKVKPGHPIQDIHSANREVAEWIFDKYSSINNGPYDSDSFTIKNKAKFINHVSVDQELIDYYLYGLQTKDSELLVNFVSSSTKPDVALHTGSNDKIIILFWISKNSNDLYISRKKIGFLLKKIKNRSLPELNDSFYPVEDEYAIKGAIFPHFILCAFDLKNECIIINPWLYKEKHDWKENGLQVDQSNFLDFAKTTNYSKVIYLWSDGNIKNENVS